jgi:hypothetical protein
VAEAFERAVSARAFRLILAVCRLVRARELLAN